MLGFACTVCYALSALMRQKPEALFKQGLKRTGLVQQASIVRQPRKKANKHSPASQPVSQSAGRFVCGAAPTNCC